MRKLHCLAIATLLLALAPATSGLVQADQRSAAQSADLDILFGQLATASDDTSARAIADEIWTIWTQPDDPVLAARVEEIISSGGFAGPSAQLPLINALIEDYPDYPEGWNLRATANFLRGDYEAALADIKETLKREPRHFGAMAGRAIIFHNQGRQEEALDAIEQALEIHPFLPERGLFPALGQRQSEARGQTTAWPIRTIRYIAKTARPVAAISFAWHQATRRR